MTEKSKKSFKEKYCTFENISKVIIIIIAFSAIAYAYFEFRDDIYIFIKTEVEELPANSTFHDIYYITAPFGFLYESSSAETYGSFLYAFGFGGGTISSNSDGELIEIYKVKYLDGTKLKTLEFKSSEIDIEIDGIFALEEVTYNKFKVLDGEILSVYRNATRTEYVIHIPYLPEIPNDLTTEFQTVN